MCVFIKEQYIELLSLLIRSMCINGNINTSNTHILIITSSEFQRLIQSELETYILKTNILIKYYTLNLNTIMEASCCKLNIFDYADVNIYTKILYLDTDILINGDINILFNLNILQDKLYALEEGTIGGPFWGKEFFDSSKFKSSITTFSALTNSIFCKANTQIIELNTPFLETKKHFQDIAECFNLNYSRYTNTTSIHNHDLMANNLIINDIPNLLTF